MTSVHGSASPVAGDLILESLGPLAARRLAGIGGVATFAAGEVILREGRPTPWLGIVDEGRVALRLNVPERGPRTILTIEPGELLGWSAIVPPFRATSEAIAVEPTTIRFFPAEELRGLLATDPELTSEVLPIVVRVVSDRLTVSWQQLLDLFSTGTTEPW